MIIILLLIILLYIGKRMAEMDEVIDNIFEEEL